MPVVSFNVDDLCDLLGRNIDVTELEKHLPMMGTPWEGSEEDQITLEIFPNRPDLLSIEGLARAFAGYMGFEIGLKSYKAEKTDFKLLVDSNIKEIRPFIVAAVVDDIDFSDESIASVMSFQEKLHITHCRMRKKGSIGIYDAYDLDFPLKYRAVALEELKFTPLDSSNTMTPKEILTKHPTGIEYAHLIGKKAPLLADAQDQVLSMPPIINSEETRVSEYSETLVVDVTGTSLQTVSQALNNIVACLADRGGKIKEITVEYPYEVLPGKTTILTPQLQSWTMKVEKSYLTKSLGQDLSNDEIISLLGKMRFNSSHNNGYIEVIIPCYRTDILHPVDFVEEIAIAYGYENFVPTVPELSTIGSERDLDKFSRKLAYLLCGFGAQEVMPYILTSPKENFDRMELERDLGSVASISNPKTLRYTICRNWLLPSLMDILSRNTGATYPQKIFEIGECVVPTPLNVCETGALNIWKLCYAEAGVKAGYTSVRGILEGIFFNLGLQTQYSQLKHPSLIEGRSAKIQVQKGNGAHLEVGFLGEVHPQVLENWGFQLPVGTFELDVEKIQAELRF